MNTLQKAAENVRAAKLRFKEANLKLERHRCRSDDLQIKVSKALEELQQAEKLLIRIAASG